MNELLLLFRKYCCYAVIVIFLNMTVNRRDKKDTHLQSRCQFYTDESLRATQMLLNMTPLVITVVRS